MRRKLLASSSPSRYLTLWLRFRPQRVRRRPQRRPEISGSCGLEATSSPLRSLNFLSRAIRGGLSYRNMAVVFSISKQKFYSRLSFLNAATEKPGQTSEIAFPRPEKTRLPWARFIFALPFLFGPAQSPSTHGWLAQDIGTLVLWRFVPLHPHHKAS